ncbi:MULTISPECIES: protease complex subunit PrcB family protein [Flavobacterium]|uniref:Protease complex subunit PrcB family protein n=1 Tax=Flavobacterium gawalongense TaxID=2594432 RepID=A0A553BLE0_9FLAO|nr:protease complex subunit PrcB family protein [Flavobacterium gawalongense]TRX00851.1 protease complex subunit PrcB family protein [Flavobacterium gawalongense]TRX05152.1 protease complex subunit PrcB family protein [Flavobacterium gawalongense]TRX09069.1 protease complex subunit PrcB family protein [Flavobacterium gawalongense]TRX10204.1 protease complex subunit PrcB family protein [Flavobacterium gawalongense]TRX27128.1 protease complex subunit PrcB family protein [Flavobacterium gawalonge
MKKLPLLFFGILLVSCGASTTKSTDKRPLFEVLTQQTDGGASIRFFEILSEPNEIKMLQNDENLKDKISPNDIQTSNFIVLNMGEKTSGGYSIGIDNAVETDKNIIVTVKETNPEPGGMVTQAFTNPFCVVRINSKKEIIIK